MSYLKNKKVFYKKLIFCSSLSFAAISTTVATNFLISTKNENIELLDSNQTASTTTSTYDHTNYFSLPSTMPTSFNDYYLFAQTNNSQYVQTNLGVLGISKDKKTFYFTTYSGRIIWAQQFGSNSLVKKFYETKNWTVSDSDNLVIKEWTILSVTNKTLAVLLGDNSHQFIAVISLDTGFFLPTTSNYQVNVSNIFQDLSSHDYTNISRVESSGILVWKNNSLTDLKYFKVGSDSITSATANTTSISSTFTNKKILSFISNANHLYALYVHTTADSSVTNKYKQSIIKITIDSSGNFSVGTAKDLGFYISDSSSLNVDNFKNRALVSDTTGEGQLVFLDGSDTHNNLNAYSYNFSGDFTTNKTLSFEGYSIASISKSSNGNKVYIANNSSSGTNVYLGYTYLSESTLNFRSIRQSTDTGTKDYFLIPVLSYTSTEYLLLQNNSKTDISYIMYSYNNYSNVNATVSLKTWKYKEVNSKTLWDAFGQSYLPSSFVLDTVSSYLDWSNLGSSSRIFSILDKSDDNGTIAFRIVFKYTSTFSSSDSEQFNVDFYINNLYGLTSNFIFNWLDSTSIQTTSDQDKINKIAELKRTKYANQITTQEIVDNFISYTIKKADGSTLTIDSSMVSLSYSSSQNLNTLTVQITIPTTNMPNGFSSSSKRVLTKTYTGFMSLANYVVSAKSTTDVSTFAKTIYPSQLTKEQIISNFLNDGSGIDKTESKWTVDITEINDLTGSVKINVSLKDSSFIPNFSQLPSNIQSKYTSIINQVTYTGFKSINSFSSLYEKPSMTNYSGTYLPSEIWSQYKAWQKGKVNESNVILLKNINFSLTDKDNLIITCLNENTCDSDGYLDLEFSIKNNSTTVIDYNGTQYATSNGKLIFNEEFINSSVTYPYKSKWNITTANKYFYIVDTKDGTIIDSVNNEYKINIKSDSPFSSSFSNDFSSVITEKDIENLIDTEGYNYEITLETNVEGGYAVATINLSLKNPPLYNGDTSSNANFTRTIYIYNFKVPMSFIAKIAILITVVIAGLSVFILSVKFLLWRFKFKRYKNKSYKWDMREKQKEIKNQMYKKNRFVKNKSE